MIDFRYHLVSLISVFVALAIGIVLGAGPLKEPIGESLQSQVDSLRSDRDELRTELDQSKADANDLNEFIAATAPDLLKDRLPEVPVTLVRAADTNADAVNAVRDRLSEAGATVNDGGELSADAFDPKGAEDLLDTLRSIDPNLPDDDATALTTALAAAVSAGGVADEATTEVPTEAPTEGETEATAAPEEGEGTRYDQKQSEDVLQAFGAAGRLNGGSYAAADVIVLIAPPVPEAKAGEGDAGATEAPRPEANAYSAFAAELDKATPTVVAGTTAGAESGLVGYVRENDTGVSSVDSIELGAGPVITALTVAALHDDKSEGHYGFAANADALMPGAEK
ncbi:copper transporter [Brevibacterium luteolum]|uniref:copper transporter n=1 Tax=Brevibacterium luteolum TaxID=199591 RepID=UPI001C219638|nr:copper transporter [Brevibacterium luteolum]